MKKGLIIRNGGIFLISMIAIIFSEKILGKGNLMVGANAVFLLVGILNKDFRNTPVQSIVKITLLTIFMGILPFLVNMNVYTGFFINFIGMFILLYLIVYNINKSIYYPFLFGYTLLLASNVVGRDVVYRIVGLAAVGIVAVLFQLFYLKLFSKREFKGLKRSLDSLVNVFENKEDLNEFRDKHAIWSREILEYKGATYYLNHKENLELNIIALLDKISEINKKIDIQDINYSIVDRSLKNDILEIIKKIRLYVYKDIKEEELRKEILEFNERYKKYDKNIFLYEIIETINTLEHLTVQLSRIEWKDYKIRKKMTKIDVREFLHVLYDDFNINSVRFIFAFRTSFLIAICYFVISYFHIELGKWVIFTIASVSQPYNETIRNRAKERVLGTLIGAFIYYGLSLFLESPDERMGIIILAIYFYIHFRKYIENVVMITIMFLGLATVDLPNTTHATEARIFFIIIGSIVVLIGNKVIFPYNFKKETDTLLEKYKETCREVYDEIMKFDGNGHKIKTLILKARGLENKVITNSLGKEDKGIMNLIKQERKILNSIQSSFNRIEHSDITLKLNKKERLEDLNKMKMELKDGENSYILEKYLDKIDKTNEKLIYKDMYSMIVAYNKIKAL